jgi:hypothetical protein
MKMVGVLIILFVPFTQCAKDQCKSGSFEFGGMSKIRSVATSPPQDLPSDFNYHVDDMTSALVGYWVNSANDTLFQISENQGWSVSYNVSAEGYKCGPTCAHLSFIGTSLKSPSSVLSGVLTFATSTDSGDVELAFPNNTTYYMKIFKSRTDTGFHMVLLLNDASALGLAKNDSLRHVQ